MGRHTKEEVERLGVQDLEALSTQLGDNQFMMGDEPTMLDAIAFGSLVMFLDGPEEEVNAYKTAVEEKLTNLGDYHKRMKEKYYSDWDDLLHKGPVFGGKKPAKEKKEEEKKEDDKKEDDKKEEEKKEEDKKEDGEKKDDAAAEEEKKDEEKKD